MGTTVLEYIEDKQVFVKTIDVYKKILISTRILKVSSYYIKENEWLVTIFSYEFVYLIIF